MLWHSYLFAVNWHRTYTKAPKHQQGKTTRQSMCLSVRPCFTCQYHTKRLNAGSRKQRCTIARGLWFSSKRSQWNSDGITPMRAPNGKNVVFRPVENFLIQTMFRRKFMSIRHDRPQRWRCAGGGGVRVVVYNGGHFISFIVHETDVWKRYKIKNTPTVGSLAVAGLVKPLTQRRENTYRTKT